VFDHLLGRSNKKMEWIVNRDNCPPGCVRRLAGAGAGSTFHSFLPCHPSRAVPPLASPTELRCNIKRRLWLSLALHRSSTPPHHCYRPGLQQQQQWVTTPHRPQRRHCTAWRDRVPVCPGSSCPIFPCTRLCSHSHSILLLLLFPPRAGGHTERERGHGAPLIPAPSCSTYLSWWAPRRGRLLAHPYFPLLLPCRPGLVLDGSFGGRGSCRRGIKGAAGLVLTGVKARSGGPRRGGKISPRKMRRSAASVTVSVLLLLC
jgi:hypothetical protein